MQGVVVFCSFALLELLLATTTEETGSSGSDETTLLTARGISTGSSGVTNVLMVTTTVRMFNGVHGNTSDTGPVSLLGLSLEVGVVSLQERLISSLTTSANSNHSSAVALDSLSATGRKSDSSLLTILGVTNDNAR